MPGLFAGTSLERPVTCERCEKPLEDCRCPRDADGNILTPDKQTIAVRLEKRAKGKTMTVASGFDPVASDVPGILKQLKGACGAGGTIEDNRVCLQGDHRDKIAATLKGLGYKCDAR